MVRGLVTKGVGGEVGKKCCGPGFKSGDCIKGMSLAFLSTYKGYSSAFSFVKNLKWRHQGGGGLQIL